jgi:phospholipid/cholesterol/gamma-HCH transport system ATP-binding protein
MSGGGGTATIELRGVHKAFRGEPVLRGVDLAIHEGETFTILGGSGTGKSVILKHVVGLLRPDAGSVFVDGQDITDLRDDDLIEVRKNVSMIFQSAALFDSLTVHENVAYPLREHCDWPEERIADRVAACLEAVGLAGAEPLMPAELSGGMRKRVGVARGIALSPRAILYDEPTTGLDPANQKRVGDLIRSLQETLHVTSVVVTHELELCFAVSDRVALLKEGRIVETGTAEEMRRSEQPAVRAFLAGAQDEGEDGAEAVLRAAELEGGSDGP